MGIFYKWIWQTEPDEETVDRLSSSLGYGTLECKLLVTRGIDTYEKAREFFKPKLDDIHSPFLMADMQKAVERVASAIDAGEKILIYGDYDVDGTTSVALMYLYLTKITDKQNIEFYIPDRNLEGYGISDEGVEYAHKNGFSLIISLDCGIKSTDKVAKAKDLGVDFIICDHHLPGETLPDAVAVLDPKRKDCRYPYKELSGCGVGFKLCQALNEIYKIPENELFELTDLLAISIAADIVPITGENRVLAKMGLNFLRKTRKVGLRKLIPDEKLSTYNISNIVFEIAPKINAAGRISHAKTAVKLLISDNLKKAHEITDNIISLNSDRRKLDLNSTKEALDQISLENDQKFTTIVYGSNWNKGVIGIVASRLTEAHYRPTVVFTDGKDGELVASARSVSDFNIHEALERCSHLFSKFGGHHAAAGLSMPAKNLDAFRDTFEDTVADMILEHQKFPSIHIDSEIELTDLDRDFFQFHRKLAPFGPKNMKPVLALRNQSVTTFVKTMGKDDAHVKFYLKQEHTGKNIECVGFRLGKYADDFRNKKFDIVFSVDENSWKGNVSYYLNIKDVHFH